MTNDWRKTGGESGPPVRGFSLVELLIVIGVIGALISISVPALLTARASAARTTSLARVRENALTISMYAEQNRGAFPFMEADTAYQAYPEEGMGITITDPVAARWRTAYWWWSVIADFADPIEQHESYYSPGADSLSGPSHYHFSNSFVAQPELWTEQFDPDDDQAVSRSLSAARQSDVVHPSRKAMMWDAAMAYISPSQRPDGGRAALRRPVAFADQHAALHTFRDAATPIVNPLSEENIRDRPLHNTPAGVRGLDY